MTSLAEFIEIYRPEKLTIYIQIKSDEYSIESKILHHELWRDMSDSKRKFFKSLNLFVERAQTFNREYIITCAPIDGKEFKLNGDCDTYILSY